MTRQVRSGFTTWSRCRAWLHRLVDDQAYDEWEEDTRPADEDPRVTRDPGDLIDEMLHGERRKDDPTAT
ncbi:MAG TPA: hypothetical protein VHZ05_02960 [Acidimicrobiales bacterium]|nr:hypothetical protein [Acidimicrobiales bacterium]